MGNLELDSRYAPQPESLKVPLYPEADIVEPGPENTKVELALGKELSLSLGVNPDSLILGTSASSLIRAYIAHKVSDERANELVAVPHYSCQSLIDAVIDGGGVPVFYDIEPDARVAQKGIDYAIRAGCSIFVWPTFFGASERNGELVSELRQAQINTIFDDAQADLFSAGAQQTRSQVQRDEIVAYSFGKSKLLASSGGGSLYGPLGSDYSPVIRDLVLQAKPGQSSLQESVGHNQEPQFVFDTQDALLESRAHEGSPNLRMSELDAVNALRSLNRYLMIHQEHQERYRYLRDVLVKTFGETSLHFLQDIDNAPSILAIKVPANRRYEIMVRLSEEGVQSTWYYYPIHRISRYRDYPAQDDIGAIEVAGSIIMLPFQWKHTDEQVDTLARAINKLGDL